MAEKPIDIEQAEGLDRELAVLAWANHVVAFARYIRDESRRPTELMAVGPVGYGSRQWEKNRGPSSWPTGRANDQQAVKHGPAFLG